MSEREQFTIRVPAETMNRVREASRVYGESINDLIVSSLEKELARRERARLLERINKRRAEMAAAVGIQQDSTPLVRELRSGLGRRDDVTPGQDGGSNGRH